MTSPSRAVAPSSLPPVAGTEFASLKRAIAGATARVVPASMLGVRPAPETVSFGIAEVDELTGGLPRGGMVELYGPASSGRTGVLLSVMAEMTHRQEVCALVDASDSFDPASAEAAGVDLRRLLWIRCQAQARRDTKQLRSRAAEHKDEPSASMAADSGWPRGRRQIWRRLERVLKATDLLLQSGGFGMVAIDLGDISADAARRIPLASWFRFRRAVENTRTVLLVIAQESCAQTCASLAVKLSACFSAMNSPQAAGRQLLASDDASPTHARLLRGFEVKAELIRSRFERKPVRSVEKEFSSRTAWAG